MKTYLIFKRQQTVDGQTRVMTKIVPVDILDINSGEGWLLSGHTDAIEVVTEDVAPQKKANASESVNVTKFDSDVLGTAKLVRLKDTIKIVSRRGKKTYNQTTPDNVCISDVAKIEFFNSCKKVHGFGQNIYEFSQQKNPASYNYWDAFMTEEYNKQRERFITRENKHV